MQRSESIKNLSKALCEFHTKVRKVKKTSFNPFFKNKYAALPDILDAISEPLNECGLCIYQTPEGNGTLTTMLIHGESGEYLESTFDMMAAQKNPQGLAAATTYARRIGIGSVLNLNIDEDDDGNKASEPNNSKMNKENPYLQSYKTPEEVFKLIGSASNEADLYALHNANKGIVEANPGLTEDFKKRKEWLQGQGK